MDTLARSLDSYGRLLAAEGTRPCPDRDSIRAWEDARDRTAVALHELDASALTRIGAAIQELAGHAYQEQVPTQPDGRGYGKIPTQ